MSQRELPVLQQDVSSINMNIKIAACQACAILARVELWILPHCFLLLMENAKVDKCALLKALRQPSAFSEVVVKRRSFIGTCVRGASDYHQASWLAPNFQ